MSPSENPHAASPSHSEVIGSNKAVPSVACVPVVDHMTPTSHVDSAAVQVLAPTTLTEVEDVLPEQTMAVSGASRPPATGTYCKPTISGIGAPIPEEHAGMPATFKHLESRGTPSM
jgi:hypothetical protein